MPVIRFIRWCLLLLLASLFTPSLSAELLCMTQWNRISIGMVTALPFTADVLFTEWQILPNGEKKQSEIVFRSHIARDGNGRVSIQAPISLRRLPPGGETGAWRGSICDPQDHTSTYITNISATIYKYETCTGLPWLIHYRGQPFQRPLMNTKYIVADLGPKNFGDIRANGYLYSVSNSSNPHEGETEEQWLSETMQMELAHIETHPDNQSETRAIVSNIQLGEPPATLFEIPTDLRDKTVTVKGEPATQYRCLSAPH